MKKFISALLLFSQIASATYLGDPTRTRNGGTGVDSSASTGVCIDTAGTWSFATGATAGHVLTSNGAGVAPTFQAVPGTGTVTTVSVVSANGFAGSVANASSTPAITISTTITGVLKGNGTAVSQATAGTDYEVPLTFSTGLTRSTNTITVNTSQNIATLSNLTSNGLVTTSGGVGTLSVTATTGSGNVVLATSPTIVTPTIAKISNLTSNGIVTTSGGDGTLSVTATTGSGNVVLATSPTITTPTIAKLANLTTNGYVKTSGGDGTLGVQTVAIPVPDGGTGQTTYTDGQLLIGNTSGNTLTKSTLTAGANITITNGNGSITIASTGGGGGAIYKFRTTCGQGTGDANTRVLLTFDDASVPYDYGINSQPAWSYGGSTTTSTTNQFGGRSLDASPSSSGALTPSTADNNLGSGNFTVEFWLYTGTGVRTNTYGLGGNNASGSAVWGMRTTGSSTIQWFQGNTAILTTSNWASGTSNNTWYHIAAVRNSGTLSIYVNGTSLGSVSDSTNYNATGTNLFFGYHPVGNENLGGGGLIDEARISSTARYTANFTPPAAAFTISNTISYDPSGVLTSVAGGGLPGICTLNTTGISTEAVCHMSPVTSTVGSYCNPTSSGTTSPAFKCFVNSTAANTSVVGTCM